MLKRAAARFLPRRSSETPLAIEPAAWPAWLEAFSSPPPEEARCWQLSSSARITICGDSLHSWAVHLWFQRLPLPQLSLGLQGAECLDPHNLRLSLPPSVAALDGLQRLALNLELPPVERARHWFNHLAAQQLIFDPDPSRVALLRALGLNAQWLDAQTAEAGWLLAEADRQQWGARLGLPWPVACTCLVLGQAGEAWEHALADWECRGEPAIIHYLPELPEPAGCEFEAARLMAAWLWFAAQRAEYVIALAADAFSGELALRCLTGTPLQRFQSPITPSELIAELQGRPQAVAEDRLSPQADPLFVHETGDPAQASVVISLYNYGDHIETALNSVKSQTLAALELIVVDDASTDHGSDSALLWLEQHATRFSRVQLLRHRINTGLAAARNTAFAATTAEWAFVLDADNLLFPAAVEACLEQALAADSTVAVVHPWIEVIGDGSHGHDGRSLISRLSWRREAFLNGNVLDAMALIRRSAWQAVGGYTHIEGGWEDFDFWCKLIEAGFHGLLCPRVLARYHTHATSMTANSTASNWRPLSRCLQERHPWLDLPYAC